MSVKFVDDQEAEKASVVVCMPLGPSTFDDNEEGECSMCGRKIMFRPYVPKAPPKICLVCAFEHIDKDADVMVTNRVRN